MAHIWHTKCDTKDFKWCRGFQSEIVHLDLRIMIVAIVLSSYLLMYPELPSCQSLRSPFSNKSTAKFMSHFMHYSQNILGSHNPHIKPNKLVHGQSESNQLVNWRQTFQQPFTSNIWSLYFFQNEETVLITHLPFGYYWLTNNFTNLKSDRV